jgi:hypothetical protein
MDRRATIVSVRHPGSSSIQSLQCGGMEPARTSGLNNARPRPTISIIAVAVFQIAVSVLTLAVFERAARMIYFSDQTSAPANTPFGLCTLLGTALLELITAIGLLRLKNGARQMSLCIVTVPLCVFAIAATLRKPHPPWDFTALLLELALWVLIPVSIWWWILFTRKRIRAQFH